MIDEDIINLDQHEQEKVFLGLPEPDRWRVMFSMLAYLRREIPVIKKEQIEFREELRDVRKVREGREKDMKSTNEKIAEYFSKKFDFWVWFRDKVLPQVFGLIVLAILYLAFGKP